SKASLTRIVENTLDGLTRRIGEMGSDLKDVLFLEVALQSVRARGSAQQKESRMYQGAKKTLSACRQHLLPAVAEQPPTLNFTDVAQIVRFSQPRLLEPPFPDLPTAPVNLSHCHPLLQS